MIKTAPNELVRQRRRDFGMTQFELAEAIGVDDTTISKIEKGTRQPSIEVFSRLSQVFGAIFALQFIEGLND